MTVDLRVFFASALVVAPIAAQGAMHRAVASLAVPREQIGACSSLLSDPPAAVAALRPLLRDTENGDPERLRMGLYVTGRLGRDAVAALPDVIHALERGLQPDVRRQALWALGQIAPHAPRAETCSDCIEAIHRYAAPDIDQGLAAIVLCRLRLGPAPEPDAIVNLLRDGGARAVAAAEASEVLLARARDEVVLRELRAALQRAIASDTWQWDRFVSHAPAAGSVARALWRAEQRDTLVGRGLLQHWDPEMRQQGLLALGGAAALTDREWVDVVRLLDDADSRVRDLAFGTITASQSGGCVALCRLAAGASGDDRGFAAACERAAARVIAAGQGGSGELLGSAYRALKGERVAADAPAAQPADIEALASVAVGCDGSTGGAIERLAELVIARRAVAPATIDAFLWCLGTRERGAWYDVLRAVIRLGPAVAAHHSDIDVLVLRATIGVQAPLRIAAVADAWGRAGEASTDAQLREAIRSDRGHVVLRALCEVIRRGGEPTADVVAAAADATGRDWQPVSISMGEDWGRERGWSHIQAKPDERAIDVAAALVLLAAGDDRWRRPELLKACAGALRSLAGDTEEALLAAKQAGRLAELGATLEEESAAGDLALLRR